jgi:beta-N-acetylhexosaminidase
LNHRGVVTRRTVVGGLASLAGTLALPLRQGANAQPVPATPRVDASGFAADIGAMLMVGFTGDTVESRSAKVLADHIAAGRIGGAIFRKMNVGSRDDLGALLRLLSPPHAAPLLAIDHEGGFVQRLVGPGFTRLPPARQVAVTHTPAEAKALYARAATEFAATGFNLNLAPVVDVDDSDSPAIGHFGRAFDREPVRIVAYAEAFIDAFAAAGVHCALKHFPGEGRAREDSHETLPDITATWSTAELEPYVGLIGSGRAQIVMTGNVRLSTVEPRAIPATLSSAVVTDLLRDGLGFKGVAMTDDLDMASVRAIVPRKEAVVRALAAGNDLLMVCNTTDFDPDLPQHVAGWVRDAIARGELSEARIAASAARIRALKRTSS